MAHGAVNWNELNTHDVAKAKDFYGRTLRWTFEDVPMGENYVYTLAKLGDQQVAGIAPMQPGTEDVPDYWLTYFTVDDIDPLVATAVEMGCTVLQAPFDIPNIGRFAILTDLGGARFGWIVPVDNS